MNNRYVFEVDKRADKGQIKRAIEGIYGVRVLSVATQVRKGHHETKLKWDGFGLVTKSALS